MLRNTAERFKSDFMIKVSKSGLNIVRHVTSVNLTDVTKKSSDTSHDRDWENALPYDRIPGPKGIKGLLAFLPGGKYDNLGITGLHKMLKSDYGNIVKMRGFLNRNDIIIIYDPNDFEKLFRTAGTWPYRKGFDCMEYYRKNYRPSIYAGNAGLAASQGQEWATFRTKVNSVMLLPKIVKQYIPGIDNITFELIDIIKRDRDSNSQVSDKFALNINTWAMESIAFIALDTRFHALTNRDPSSDSFKLMSGFREMLQIAYELNFMPSIWKFVKTPLFYKQMRNSDNITDLVMKYIDMAIQNLGEKHSKPRYSNDESEESVLEKLLKIDRSVAIVMASDMCLAGADTTGSLSIGLIYSLAKNPDKQEKLRKEILKILPEKNSRLTAQSLNNIPYLRACLKEALRTQSPTGGILRGAGKDLVLQGYQIPKGTDLTTANMTLFYDDKYFPESKKFIPERWLANDPMSSESLKVSHPFVFLPFGYGVRSCIGRRFAELETECLIARLVRAFQIEWHGDNELQYKFDILNNPIGHMPFRFKDIEF